MIDAVPMLNALGWALLHSIWQITAIAIIAAVALRVIAIERSALRCAIAFSGMIGCLLAFLITFALQLGTAPAGALVIATEQGALRTTLAESTSLVASLWLAGIAVLLTRYAAILHETRQLKKRGLRDVPAHWSDLFENLTARLGAGANIELFESSRVRTPLTIGLFKPVVLVPVGFFFRLPADQAEAILIHELAHICRQDYVFGLVQEFLNAIFFYHPGIYYLSRQTDIEREHACDALVVRETGAPEALAAGLGRIALESRALRIGFAVAANDDRTPVIRRIRRLAQRLPVEKSDGGIASFAIAMLFIGTSALAIGADAFDERKQAVQLSSFQAEAKSAPMLADAVKRPAAMVEGIADAGTIAPHAPAAAPDRIPAIQREQDASIAVETNREQFLADTNLVRQRTIAVAWTQQRGVIDEARLQLATYQPGGLRFGAAAGEPFDLQNCDKDEPLRIAAIEIERIDHGHISTPRATRSAQGPQLTRLVHAQTAAYESSTGMNRQRRQLAEAAERRAEEAERRAEEAERRAERLAEEAERRAERLAEEAERRAERLAERAQRRAERAQRRAEEIERRAALVAAEAQRRAEEAERRSRHAPSETDHSPTPVRTRT